ncbi:MAG TPA: aldehyde dehydrogenase family protein [Anaerolineales bacterium]|nr:aldehyde dehydrogenase family protein [Anaerolineales bacterium]
MTSKMKVAAEEAFAPIASVIACDNFEESMRQADQYPTRCHPTDI